MGDSLGPEGNGEERAACLLGNQEEARRGQERPVGYRLGLGAPVCYLGDFVHCAGMLWLHVGSRIQEDGRC